MPIVRAGDLARWAGRRKGDTLVVLGDCSEYEDADSDIRVRKCSELATTVHVFVFKDEPDMGFVLTERVYGDDEGVWRGVRAVALGGDWR